MHKIRVMLIISALLIMPLAVSWSEQVQVARLSPIISGGMGVKDWFDGADFHCGWETGTGTQNTTPTAPEDAWTAVVSDDALSKNLTAPLNGSNADLLVTVSAAEYDYVSYTFSDDIFALRFRFKLTDGLPNDEDLAWILTIRSASGDRIYIKVDNESAQLRIYGVIWNGTDSNVDIGTVNINEDTEYQIELFYDAVAPKVGVKVWDRYGGPVGSAERTINMTTETMTTFRFGVYNCTVGALTKYQLDNFYYDADATTYIGPEP